MKKFIKFLSGSILIQIASALCGFLLIRWLSVEDYALYTAVTIIFGAVAVLTKCGVHLGLSAILGRVWPDRVRSKQALLSALYIRKKIIIVILPIIIISSSWVFHQNGANVIVNITLCSLLIVLCFFDYKSRLSDQIVLFANKAHNLQFYEAVLAIVRPFLVVFCKVIGALNLTTAVIASVVVAGLRIWPVKLMVNKEIPKDNVECVKDDLEEIKIIAKRQLPLELFLVFQSQIVLFLLAYTGNVHGTAAMGALNRIGQLFFPVTHIMNAYAVPRFCKLHDNNWVQGLLVWSLVALIPGIILCISSLSVPEYFLWLIGDNYANYAQEVFITAVFFSCNIFSSFVRQLVSSRGLNKYAIVQIPCFIIWCVIFPIFLDLDNFSNILWFQLGYPMSVLFSTIIDVLYGMKSRNVLESHRVVT